MSRSDGAKAHRARDPPAGGCPGNRRRGRAVGEWLDDPEDLRVTGR
jgi:hypothetical protein